MQLGNGGGGRQNKRWASLKDVLACAGWVGACVRASVRVYARARASRVRRGCGSGRVYAGGGGDEWVRRGRVAVLWVLPHCSHRQHHGPRDDHCRRSALTGLTFIRGFGGGARHCTLHRAPAAFDTDGRGVLKRGKKKVFLNGSFCKKTACSSYVQPWLVAIGGWRLATGGWWRLVVVDGGWWLVIGGWWRLAVVAGWRLAVGCRWRLAAVGG